MKEGFEKKIYSLPNVICDQFNIHSKKVILQTDKELFDRICVSRTLIQIFSQSRSCSYQVTFSPRTPLKAMVVLSMLWLLFMVVYSEDLPQLPLVPYPQHVSLISSLPAVIDPLRFTFSTKSKSILLQEVQYKALLCIS